MKKIVRVLSCTLFCAFVLEVTELLQILHVFNSLDNAIGTDAKFFQKDKWWSRTWNFTDAHFLDNKVAFVTNDIAYSVTNATLRKIRNNKKMVPQFPKKFVKSRDDFSV